MSWLRAINLYPTVGIMLFGVAIGWLLGLNPWPLAPYWLCGGLVMYNLDRALPHASDAANTPGRYAIQQQHRRLSIIVGILAAACLLIAPLLLRQWRIAGCTWGGVAIAIWYTLPLPILRKRLKELPGLSSLFPALGIAAAILVLLAIANPQAPAANTKRWILLGAWLTAMLLCNVVLCDWRDRAGDAAAGVRSLPVIMGEPETRNFLHSLLVIAIGISLLFGPAVQDFWTLQATAIPTLFLGLLVLFRNRATPRREFYFEYLVDGFLYLTFLQTALSPHGWAS